VSVATRVRDNPKAECEPVRSMPRGLGADCVPRAGRSEDSGRVARAKGDGEAWSQRVATNRIKHLSPSSCMRRTARVEPAAPSTRQLPMTRGRRV